MKGVLSTPAAGTRLFERDGDGVVERYAVSESLAASFGRTDQDVPCIDAGHSGHRVLYLRCVSSTQLHVVQGGGRDHGGRFRGVLRGSIAEHVRQRRAGRLHRWWQRRQRTSRGNLFTIGEDGTALMIRVIDSRAD